MATVTVSLVEVESRAIGGAAMPVRKSVPHDVASEITSSGTSQKADIAAPSSDPMRYFWEVLVSGGDVWLKAGDNPTAASGDDTKVRDGERVYLGVSAAGEELAVIDA